MISCSLLHMPESSKRWCLTAFANPMLTVEESGYILRRVINDYS
jgi:hypothetical protein